VIYLEVQNPENVERKEKALLRHLGDLHEQRISEEIDQRTPEWMTPADAILAVMIAGGSIASYLFTRYLRHKFDR